MLLDQLSWALAHRIDSVLPASAPARRQLHRRDPRLGAGDPDRRPRRDRRGDRGAAGAARASSTATLRPLSMRAASAGTHPFAVWQEIVVSAGDRYQFVYGSMRELARREPTFGLHVHVGVPDPEVAIHVANRLRTHIPLLLALSVNSPFWQGRDTGLASARTPLFQAFPGSASPAPSPTTPITSSGRRADPLRRRAGADLPLVGRAAAAALRHGRGADHGRPDELADTAAIAALVQSHRPRRGRATGPPANGRCRRRCSRRTASSPPATAWTPS